METTLENQTTNSKPERPQFLTVLCILSWVACGFIFLSTIWGIIAAPSAEKQMEQIENMRQISPEAADQMEAALEAQNGSMKLVNNLITLLALGISAFGVTWMWQLKSKGFMLYLVGELLPYIGFLLGGAQAMSAIGAMTGMSGSAMVGIALTIMLLFDGAFIAMYAVNRKHMTQ